MKREIRFEAIGGQGAHSAGKILAEAAVLGMGYEGNHFSSFGSEKRGSSMRSFVRYRDDGKPARSTAPILRPDILVIFHEALIHTSARTCEGSDSRLVTIVNSPLMPDQVAFPIGFKASRVATIDASAIARRYEAGVNAVLLGAISTICEEINLDKIETAFQSYFAKNPSARIMRNIQALKEGRKRVKIQSHFPGSSYYSINDLGLPKLGYENAPIGGVIPNPGNSLIRDLSHSRKGTFPKLDFEKCIHCGRCDMVCPDYCFVWQSAKSEVSILASPLGNTDIVLTQEPHVPFLQGIDYQYCKGCQKCIQACPVQALTLAPDTPENRKLSYAKRFHSAESSRSSSVHFHFPLFSESDDENES